MKPPSAKSCPVCGERYEGDVLFCSKDGTPLASTRGASLPGVEGDPYVGLDLAGQIRIKTLIGIGSMGRVYRAFQAGIERDVAVKILHRELSGNQELVGRFHREAKVASRLVHPNVVQVLMTGTVPLRADPRVGGEMYLAMEYLDGISLLSALAAAGNTGDTAALPLPRALHIVLQLCDAVGEAHAQGIVHRDLKPENVMLIRRGEDPDFVKVLDFGIARIDWANQSMATQAGLIFGTAKYISPEGASGEGVGPQADVYSIATVLYQCLAGRAPFEDESPVALLVQHTHSPPPELRSIPRAKYVPAPIAEVIMQNLAKKPSARAQDARAFGRDLVAAMRASGLDPEEIIAHSTLLVRGAVRFASHARTKNMDMTPELASVIAQASKAPPLAAPPPPPPAAPPLAVAPPPLPAAPPRRPEAILVGIRPTDTMVVDASELIDLAPPPLPAPPPIEESPVVEAAPVEAAAMTTTAGAVAVEPAATEESAAPTAEPRAALTTEGDVAREPVEPRASTTGASTEAAARESLPAVSPSAPGLADMPAARASRPSLPDTPAVRESLPALPEMPAARASAPGEPPLDPAGLLTPQPASLRTLFDAPAPEAVSIVPPLASEAGLAPVEPSRPGATVVGPAPFEDDSMDMAPPPQPGQITAPEPRASAGFARSSAAILANPGRRQEQQLDWSDDGTIQGATTEPVRATSADRSRAAKGRSRLSRVIAIVALGAVAAMSAVAFAQYFSQTGSAEQAGTVDELVEQARECERMRAWDSPPGANVKEITARALEQSPNEPRILDLRRDAAEKIVTEALGRKYAGDREQATRLAKVALEMNPELTTAQHLVAELEREAAAAAAAAGTAATDTKGDDPPTAKSGEPAVASAKTANPKATAKPTLPPGTSLPTAKPAGSSVAPSKTGKPSTPPPGTGAAVLPPPTNTGPWL
jgi:serine/threonine protein kinase